jgi:alkylhydroperoxidase family enzyme
MARIPTHTIQDAPEASRPLLEGVLHTSPTGRLLNLHSQMANSPAVLDAYVSIRKATAAHGTLEPPVRSALMLATADVDRSEYAREITSMLALQAGWSHDQVRLLRGGQDVGDEKVDALVRLVREAAASFGHVRDETWESARRVGWTNEQLTEAFAYLGLTVFTAYFLNYARTELDLEPAAKER